MFKEQFNKEINEINVEKSEIFDAIDKGIEKGRNEKTPNRMSKAKILGTIASVAASTFLASGLVFAPITNVLASVPLIGSIYENFSMQIGSQLSKSGLVTQLNQNATSNNVDITITSAYYDGNIIGITFKAQGDRLSFDNVGGDKGPETGYGFHLFGGDEREQWSSSMTGLEETEDGYVAAMEFENPDANLPKDYNLPLTFTSIAGVKGNWTFNVPVQQIPSETIYTQAEGTHKDYTLKMESVEKGKATTMLNYNTTFPIAVKNDDIILTVIDNEGNKLSPRHAAVLETEQNGDLVEKETRELFNSKINGKAEYLTIKPEIVQHEEDTVTSLDLTTPFMVESERFDYSIRVNKVEQSGNKLILDYNVQSVDTDTIRKDIVQNFANFIMLIKSNNIYRDENGNLEMEKMLENRIRSNTAKLKDEERLHFKSTYTIENPGQFNIRDYSIMVPFGTLSANDNHIKMDPIKIDLKE
ncbi:protein of unknown function [Virgibacillus subterraneus]|uniref:DUF4179 domain-containing protein n=1 Tax=Virgibacillus subterraneus TaxID=621109 RepID=A0A1H9FK53_9BACI|nr:DUF4179 domain-containing protein [Virgibacillus subterraneus]SEQ38175.1 protein of unknown function [Virgibacillus subterraneus]